MMSPMASGARPVRTSVRSWFWAAGPPTAASGTCVADGRCGVGRPCRRWPESSTAVAGVTRTTVRPTAAGSATIACVDDVRSRRRRARRPSAACVGRHGDEQRRGGAGAERLDEHLVAVAARATLVDDPGAGHAEAHADRRCGDAGAGARDRRRACGPGGRAPGRSSGPSGPRRRGRGRRGPWRPAPGRRATTSTAGSSVSEASATATTERIMPSAIERKTMTGTTNTAASESTTVSAERNTALPAVESVLAIASSAS